MRDIGLLLCALGASSLILRMMGRQPLVMSVLGPYERPAAIAFVAIGVALLAYSFWKKRKKDAPKAT
jgi:hypothetical protein